MTISSISQQVNHGKYGFGAGILMDEYSRR